MIIRGPPINYVYLLVPCDPVGGPQYINLWGTSDTPYPRGVQIEIWPPCPEGTLNLCHCVIMYDIPKSCKFWLVSIMIGVKWWPWKMPGGPAAQLQGSLAIFKVIHPMCHNSQKIIVKIMLLYHDAFWVKLKVCYLGTVWPTQFDPMER